MNADNSLDSHYSKEYQRLSESFLKVHSAHKRNFRNKQE